MPPRILIVGGGPIGMVAAHALDRAGIEFLLLEQRGSVVVDAGGGIVLSPLGLRALGQLGLTSVLNKVSSPLGNVERIDHAGRDIGDSRIFLHMKDFMGTSPRVINRHDLNRILYDNLSATAQKKIIPGKRLSKIMKTVDGVVAECTDGTTYSAKALIGADGAHSAVRHSMRTLALDNGSQQVNEESPFLTTFRCLWVKFPIPKGVSVGSVTETHGAGLATQLFVGQDSGVIGVYESLPSPTKDRTRYTEADQDAMVGTWGHLPVVSGTNLTLRDVYTDRMDSGMVSLEEGTVPHWHWDGRIVLVGDAAHKFTPSTGSGCNNGIIDIVVLANQLRGAFAGKTAVDRASLTHAFTTYQQIRYDTVQKECKIAGQVTATATWQNGVRKFLDCHVLSSHFLQKILISAAAKTIESAPSFEFERADVGTAAQAVAV